MLMPQLEKTINEFNQLNLSSVGENLLSLDDILDTSDKAHLKFISLNESFSNLKPLIDSADRRVKQLIKSNVGLALSSETANDQIQQVLKVIPENIDAWESAKTRLINTTSLVENCKLRLALLKEKIAVARDKANRVKNLLFLFNIIFF